MNFLLKHLELELDEHHLLVGEKLLEEGKVLRLFENERNLWIAVVESMEVELQISPSRVRACSCECRRFQEENMCGHVAAGLLALRRHLTENKAEPKKSKKKQPLLYQKLTINSILDNVKTDDLTAFVRQYAQSNRSFALALKTRFAANVPMSDSREKYGQLLEMTILAGRNKNDHISVAGTNQLMRTIRELMAQAEDALALEHFRETWAIFSVTLEKTAPILRKIDGDDEPLRLAISNVFEKIEQLLEQQIPPALRLEIWSFFLEALSRPAYRLNELSEPMLKLLLLLANDLNATKNLLQAIDSELEKPPVSEQQTLVFLKTKMLLLEKKEMEHDREAFTLQCLSSPQSMLQTVEAAKMGGLLRFIEPIIEKGLRLMKVEAVRIKLEEALLELAHEQGDWRKATGLAKDRFLETKNFDYFEKCKESFKGNWSAFIQNLLAEIIQQPDYQDNIELIANILAREKRNTELLELIAGSGSLDLFMQFDHLLLQSFPDRIFEFYDSQLKSYLSNHFGPVPSQRVKVVLDHLRALDAGRLAEKLTTSLLESFSNRFSLVEELEVL